MVYWSPTDPEQAAGQEAVQRAVDYATSKDVINVVAAGNFSTDLDNLPTTDDSAPGDTWGAHDVSCAAPRVGRRGFPC